RMYYHRLNDDYQPIHRLCRLFLELLSLEHQSGETELRAFLIDMNALFEKYVAKALEGTTPVGGKVLDQEHRHLDVGKTISIKPDLVLRYALADILIADTKYKDVDNKDVREGDLYQMTAYCLSQGVDDGLLIYPASGLNTDKHYLVRNSGIRIRAITIDLGMPPDEFARRSTEIGDRIWNLAITAAAEVQMLPA
ncbi:MAG TPA: hypothetical protein PK819_12790, partial [Thermomicrobiales bacterium]|nr:hypothetical protein [Thermomicrobiales bacterium]